MYGHRELIKWLIFFHLKSMSGEFMVSGTWSQICEQAAFSSHPVDEVEYERVYQYVRQARKLMKKKLPAGRKFRMLLQGSL